MEVETLHPFVSPLFGSHITRVDLVDLGAIAVSPFEEFSFETRIFSSLLQSSRRPKIQNFALLFLLSKILENWGLISSDFSRSVFCRLIDLWYSFEFVPLDAVLLARETVKDRLFEPSSVEFGWKPRV